MPGEGGYCQPYMLADLPDQNVVALLPSAGPSRWLLLGAHYDGQGTSPGGRTVFPSADDNASGAAALLEMARLLTTNRQRPWSTDVGIVISLFGGEEHAQGGSKAWLAAPPVPLEDIELMINLDMVGRRLGAVEQPRPLRSQSSPSLHPALARAASRVGLDWRELAPEEVAELAFDHTPFAPYLPTVLLTSGDHPDRHTPRDTLETLDHEQIRVTLAFVAALLAELFPTNSETADTAFAAWFESRIADRHGSRE